MNKKRADRGFIKAIILVVIGIIILAHYGDEIKRFFETGDAIKLVTKLIDWSNYAWNHYIKEPIYFLWNKIIIDILWKSILQKAIESFSQMGH